MRELSSDWVWAQDHTFLNFNLNSAILVYMTVSPSLCVCVCIIYNYRTCPTLSSSPARSGDNRHMPSNSPLLLEVTPSWPRTAGELGEMVSSILEGMGRGSSFFYIPLFLLWMLPCENVMFATAIIMSPWKGGLLLLLLSRFSRVRLCATP